MTRLRNVLRNMGAEHAIDDGEMAQLLLMGVATTYPTLIEQFDLPTRGGHPPTLVQVTNALRSRDEQVRLTTQGGGHQNSSANVVMNTIGQHTANGQGNSRPIGVKKVTNPTAKNKPNEIKKNAKKEPGLIDHMLWLNQNSVLPAPNDESSDSEDDDCKVPDLGMVLKEHNLNSNGFWMLDCGSTTHVCMDKDAFSSNKKSKAIFKVWTGEITQGVMDGVVAVIAATGFANSRNYETVELTLEDVEYSPA
ncbi:hypothetical protein PHMEG_00041365, partial [Phytophthora megakarya]